MDRWYNCIYLNILAEFTRFGPFIDLYWHRVGRQIRRGLPSKAGGPKMQNFQNSAKFPKIPKISEIRKFKNAKLPKLWVVSKIAEI